MSDAPRTPAAPEAPSGGRRRWQTGGRVTLLAAAGILVLALAAALWPRGGGNELSGVLLVFDPAGGPEREAELYRPLAGFLAREAGVPLELTVVARAEEFNERRRRGADFLLAPDGLLLGSARDGYSPLAVGRRSAPRNLRPRGVLVYRKGAGLVPRPWLERPARTVFGDSLSLAATGALRAGGSPAAGLPQGCAWGPDPYDHAPVLHALRLGGFDYALVRQWDAERFLASGLLSPLEWGIEVMTVPVPDLVLFAAIDLPGGLRLRLGEVLAGLGRSPESESAAAAALRQGLRGLHLTGFNLLVAPDFELVRGSFPADWPPARD